jgi:hypothetical protein
MEPLFCCLHFLFYPRIKAMFYLKKRKGGLMLFVSLFTLFFTFTQLFSTVPQPASATSENGHPSTTLQGAPATASVTPDAISSQNSSDKLKLDDYVIILADNGKIIIADPPTYKLINQNKIQNSYDQIKSASGSTLPISTSMTNALEEIDNKSFVRLTFMNKAVAIMQLTLNKQIKEYNIVTAQTFNFPTLDPKFIQLISHFAPTAQGNLAKMSNNQKANGSLEAPVKKPVEQTIQKTTSVAKQATTEIKSSAATALTSIQKTAGLSVEAFLKTILPETKEIFLVLKEGSVFFNSNKALSTNPQNPVDLVSLELTKMINEKQRQILVPHIEGAKKALNLIQKKSIAYLYENGKQIGKAEIDSHNVLKKIIYTDDASKAIIANQFGTAVRKLFNLPNQSALVDLLKSK